MKKLLGLIMVVLVAVAGLFGINSWLIQAQHPQTGSQGAAKTHTLTIYNWGDYIDPALLKEFTQQTGYQVDYETFDSNEAMFTKIKQGGTHYDLAVPSEYMVAKMRRAGMLEPLDKAKLTGLQYYDPHFMGRDFDPHNRYSLPYFWGTLGIVYNDKLVAPGEIKTWNDLFKPAYHQNIMLIDSARDIMGMALASSGHSMNTRDEPTLAAAEGKLATLMPNVKAIVADEIKTYMIQEEAALAVDYSGDAAEMVANNKHLHYVLPQGISNLWLDNLVMPKTVRNKKAAYAFLNFMSEPKHAAQNAEYVGYATPNTAAKARLPKAIRTNRAWYPKQKALDDLEVYRDLGPALTQRYNDYFLEFKMTNQ